MNARQPKQTYAERYRAAVDALSPQKRAEYDQAWGEIRERVAKSEEYRKPEYYDRVPPSWTRIRGDDDATLYYVR